MLTLEYRTRGEQLGSNQAPAKITRIIEELYATKLEV